MNQGDLFLLIRSVAFLVSCLLLFAAYRRIRRMSRSDRARRAAAVVFSLTTLPGAYIAFAGHIPIPALVEKPMIVIYVLWLSSCAVFLLVSWTKHLLKKNLRRAVPPVSEKKTDITRRDFLLKGAYGSAIIVSSGALTAFAGSDEFEIVRRRIRMPRLSPKLKGFRIAMISDIHSGPHMSFDEIKAYVPAINKLRPDMILLPGDFVQNKDEEVDPFCEAAQKLEAPFGAYASLGNHDFFADPDHISREISNAGIHVLRDEHLVIDAHGEKLALIGIDDVRAGYSFDMLISKASAGLDASIPHILLCHKPYYLEEAASWGIDFMVSGHTHGGQIVLARVFDAVLTPAALITGYVEGLYRNDATQLYVTRGIGVVGIPVRVNCPPEVTLFELV